MVKTLREVGIAGTGHFVPENVVPNTFFEASLDTTDEWIFERTGMRERRFAAEGQPCSDLCIKAGRLALEDAGMDAEELQLIIVATVTPDHLLPATVAFVQDQLGAKNAGGWDVTNACTGWLSAVMSAHGMIAAGIVDNVLVIGAEVLSSMMDFKDRGSAILFGDGAGAAILKADHPRGQILCSSSGMDGRQWEAISRAAGGSKKPVTHEDLETGNHRMALHGNDVFKFAVAKFRDLVRFQCKTLGIEMSDIGLVVPHQVNLRIIQSALKKLDFDMDRIFVNLEKYANTSAASIPIAFDEARKAGRVKEGELISFIAFGAGLGWGQAVIRW
ncbi:MAG: 3-oxoacyl-[acyl-carrier-protein] synthase-3 [Planctomycetota bacterium]|jgi:3-oxoacyl-[acyl-carrier-protein] synthase-3